MVIQSFEPSGFLVKMLLSLCGRYTCMKRGEKGVLLSVGQVAQAYAKGELEVPDISFCFATTLL